MPVHASGAARVTRVFSFSAVTRSSSRSLATAAGNSEGDGKMMPRRRPSRRVLGHMFPPHSFAKAACAACGRGPALAAPGEREEEAELLPRAHVFTGGWVRWCGHRTSYPPAEHLQQQAHVGTREVSAAAAGVAAGATLCIYVRTPAKAGRRCQLLAPLLIIRHSHPPHLGPGRGIPRSFSISSTPLQPRGGPCTCTAIHAARPGAANDQQ